MYMYVYIVQFTNAIRNCLKTTSTLSVTWKTIKENVMWKTIVIHSHNLNYTHVHVHVLFILMHVVAPLCHTQHTGGKTELTIFSSHLKADDAQF